jgi:hypothetical protein
MRLAKVWPFCRLVGYRKTFVIPRGSAVEDYVVLKIVVGRHGGGLRMRLRMTSTVLKRQTRRKKEDAALISWDDSVGLQSGWKGPHELIYLCTVSFQDSMPISTYISLLKVGRTFYSLGMPEGNLPAVSPVALTT